MLILAFQPSLVPSSLGMKLNGKEPQQDDESLTTEDGEEGSDDSELSEDDEMDSYRSQNGWKVCLTCA